jgi:hypothetical protein
MLARDRIQNNSFAFQLMNGPYKLLVQPGKACQGQTL